MITGLDHFSFTVSSLEDGIHFFRDLLGMEVFVPEDLPQDAGYILNPHGKHVDDILRMTDASLKECFLKTSDNIILELIEYEYPKGKQIDLTTCNFGVAHISFFVDDLHKMYNDLTAEGVVFNNRPQEASGIGRISCYIKGPDGITIELVEKIGMK